MAGNKPKRNPGRPKAKRGRPYVKGNPMAKDDDGPLGPMLGAGSAVQAASGGDALKAYLRGLNQSLAEEQQRFGSD